MSAHEHTPALSAHADEWHHHSTAEGLPQQEHTAAVNAKVVAYWFVAIIVFVAILAIIIAVYFNSVTTQLRAERIETTLIAQESNAAKAQAEATMGFNGQPGSYTWADAKAGKVQIPIEEAMKKVQSKYTPAK